MRVLEPLGWQASVSTASSWQTSGSVQVPQAVHLPSWQLRLFVPRPFSPQARFSVFPLVQVVSGSSQVDQSVQLFCTQVRCWVPLPFSPQAWFWTSPLVHTFSLQAVQACQLPPRHDDLDDRPRSFAARA